MGNYSDLLKDPRWQKKRLEIMQRDNFTCQLCSDTAETLHVHHKSYEGKKRPWEVSSKNLITYCQSCHEVIEDERRSPHNQVIGVKKTGYLDHIAVVYDTASISKVVIVYHDHLIGITMLTKQMIDDLYQLLKD